MRVLYVVVVLVGLHVLAAAQNQQNGTNSTGLRCYACAETGGKNTCEDYTTYKDAMDGNGNEFIKKNCTSPFNVSCFIETFSTLGNTVSHIRGCSDGVHYSFSSIKKTTEISVYKRLEDLLTNNETACVWDGQNQVCLSKCNENFCNGPQLEEVISGAIWINISTSVLIFLIISHMFQRQFLHRSFIS